MNEDALKKLEEGLVSLGNEICAWRNDQKSRRLLDPLMFKTNADLKAHNYITNLIMECFTNAVILSEEDPTHDDDDRPDHYWLIDPIDGTASWYDGYDGFVTQVAYIENSTPVYGSVYAPALKKLWTAIKFKGARLNGVLMPKLVESERLNLIDNYSKPRHIALKISNSLKVSKYIECGSLGLKACMVADRVADLFVKDVIVRDWDIAPASVIIDEVGGLMSDLKGARIDFKGSFEKKNGLIVARDQRLLDKIVKVSASN